MFLDGDDRAIWLLHHDDASPQQNGMVTHSGNEMEPLRSNRLLDCHDPRGNHVTGPVIKMPHTLDCRRSAAQAVLWY
jgi:hypothetical protein